MEGSESSMNRIGRTIWTVWGFLTGAVGRYLRPDVANEGDQNVNQEDTVTRSYKELKEKEEEKEKAWSQSEKPQSGVNVRTAAVQWEKGAVRSEHASKPTRSGVAWNTEVREGRSEDVDKKGRERRDHEETSDNNNEAARASDAVADVEQVRPPASADGSQDFGVSASADEDGDVRKSENKVEDLVKRESTESVESEDLEEQTSEHDFGDTSEVLVEKVTEPTDGLDKSEDNVDDLVSKLTCSSRERGDLLNKELKVEEPNENRASPTPEEEVIDANNVATKQETVGTIKDGQHEVDHQLTEFAEVAETVESKLDEDYTEFNELVVETECELLEEPVPAPVTENAETSEKEPEPFTRFIENQISPTSGRDEIDNTEGREAGQQFKESEAAESFGICHSNLDEAHTEFTEAITETDYKLLEEAVTAQVGNVEVYEKEPTPEGDVTEAISEETADQQEAGQQWRESMGSEIADGPDIHESMVETQFEDTVEAKWEPLEEPVAEQEPKEPEAVSKPTESRISSQEGEPIDSIEDLEARQQFSESTAAEIVDVCESQLDEDHTDFAEAIVETKLEHLEEPVAEQEPKEPEPVSKPTESRISSSQEGEPIDSTEDLEARQQFSESKSAEIVDVCESQLDEDHTDFAEAIVETKLEHFEEPVAEQTDIAEIPEEPEPLGRITEKKAPEEEAILEESKQGTVGTAKDEAGQRSVDPKAAESFDVCHSKLDEAQFEFTEEVVENRHEHLEEPVAEQESKEPEPASKPTESRISSSQEREPIHSTEDLEARQQFGESKAAETVDVYESQLDEDHTEFAEAEVETKLEHLEEPVAEPTDIAEISEEPEPLSRITEKKAPEEEAIFEESKQGTVGTAKDEAGQRSVDPKAAESFDVCHSKLDEAQFEFTEEVVENRHEHLEEPVAEQESKEPEPASKPTESRISSSQEREPIHSTEDLEARQQFGESKAAETVDVYESQLDEDHTEFAEAEVETKLEHLEEPVAEPTDIAEISEEPEPLSRITEKKAPEEEAIFEESKQGTVGTAKDEAGQRSVDPKTAESFDVCHSKPDEAQFEFTEEVVETRHEQLEEPVAEQIEVHETEPEPFSKVVENRASPTPEREVLGAISEETKQVDAGQQFSESKAAESKLDEDGSDFQEGTVETACELLEEPVMAPMDLEPVSEPTEIKAAPSLKREAIEEAKLETVGTVQDGQHEAGQQLSESKDAEIVNICESNLDEAQYTEEAVTAECKLLEEAAQMYEQEPKDVSKIGLIMAETSGDESANLSEAAVEAGQLEHRGEGTEEEPSREAEVEHRDGIAKDILAEMVIKHDNESVDTGPGNQTETLETTSNFQQEVREEVVADDVKKSAERSSQAQPVAREALALQEAMDQSSLKQEPREKSVEENVNDELGLLKAPAEQEDDTPVNMPSSSPQEPEDSLAACVELMVEAKTIRTEQKVEALETHVGSTAESDQAATEVKCVRAESEMDAITESESSPAAAESSEMLKNSTEASDLDVGQIPLSLGSTTQTHGVQIEYSGALSLPESEPVDQQTSEIQRNLQKDAEDALEVLQMQRGPQKQVDVDRPDEAEIRLQEEIKTMTTSSGVVEELMSGLSQDLQERQSLSSVEPHVQTKTKKKGSAFESFVETSESESATLQTYSTNTEERKHLQVETMDLVGDEEAETDSNANVQRRTRPALKRGSEKMTRDEKDEPSKSRSWAATDLLLQQVSSLDCTVQKSKIAVKNPLVRPPKDPRTLINMASVEPLAPARPTQPGPLRTGHGVALPVPQKVTGFKLPGLGAGFPVLRKTDAGRKMRDEGETESESTPKQKSDVLTKPKEDCVKPEQPVSKPKWTPPRHPGMGGPLMMSELKSKLKKPGKD